VSEDLGSGTLIGVHPSTATAFFSRLRAHSQYEGPRMVSTTHSRSIELKIKH
jgi:hypothetical protein